MGVTFRKDLKPEERAAELQLLDAALNAFAAAMRAALVRKLDAGYSGWDNPLNGPDIYNAMLSNAAGVTLAREQEVTVANFAMFLWYHRVGGAIAQEISSTGPRAIPRGVGEGDVGVE